MGQKPSKGFLFKIWGLRFVFKMKLYSLRFPGVVVIISCIVLVGLFALQHWGTQRVAFLFAPIVIVWLLSIGVIGLFNIIYWDPGVYRALNPYYIYRFFLKNGVSGWITLGGVLLSITGITVDSNVLFSIRFPLSCPFSLFPLISDNPCTPSASPSIPI